MDSILAECFVDDLVFAEAPLLDQLSHQQALKLLDYAGVIVRWLAARLIERDVQKQILGLGVVLVPSDWDVAVADTALKEGTRLRVCLPGLYG